MKLFSNTASDDRGLTFERPNFIFLWIKRFCFCEKFAGRPENWTVPQMNRMFWEGAFMWNMTNQLNYFLLCSEELSFEPICLKSAPLRSKADFFTQGTLEILMTLNHFTWGNNRCCICQGNTLKSEQISSILTWGSFSWGTIEALMSCTILSWEDQFDQGTAELLTN